jgi:hypothetical protein
MIELTAQLIKRSFFNTSIADIYRAIDGNCLTGAYTLLFCSMDALAIIEADEDKPGEDETCQACKQTLNQTPRVCDDCNQIIPSSQAGKIFRNWCKKWIVKSVGQNDCDEQFLYELRCGLVHAHGLGSSLRHRVGFHLSHDMPQDHWHPLPISNDAEAKGLKPGFVLNLESFLAEYAVAAWNFFADIETKWGERQEILIPKLLSLVNLIGTTPDGNFVTITEPPSRFADMHPALMPFDAQLSPTVSEVQYQIHEIMARQKLCKCDTVFKYQSERIRMVERLNKFDFEKLAEFGSSIHNLMIETEKAESVDRKEFHKTLKSFANSASTILNGFPADTGPRLSKAPDYIAEIKQITFGNHDHTVEQVLNQLDPWYWSFVDDLCDMMREACSLGVISGHMESDYSRALGLKTTTFGPI